MKLPTRAWRIAAATTAAACAALLYACTDGTQTSDLQGPVVEPQLDVNIIVNPATVNGAYWYPRYDVGSSVGTGVIRPFLDMQASPYEAGFNTDNDDFVFDQHRTSDTNKLPLNYVPVINEAPVGFAREFVFDANESNSAPDPQFSINEFDLYLCDDTDAPNYHDYADFASNPLCSLVYTIAGPAPLLAADSTKGSGNVFDYRILIPESKFQDAADDLGTDLCPYLPTAAGETACGQYLVLWTTMGNHDETSDYITDATFEEFSTIIRPYITVNKTVNVYEELTHAWALDKKVNGTDGPETVVLPPLGSEDVDYAIQVDYLGSTVSSASAGGQITITYPGMGGNGKKGTPVYVHSISDLITPGDLDPDVLACTDPDGGALTLPLTSDVELTNGEAITCSWSIGGLDDGTVYENTVSVELASLTVYEYTAEISFAEVPEGNVTQVDDMVDFVDIVPPPDGDETSLGSCTAPASGLASDDPDCTAASGIGLDAGPPPAFTYSITVSAPDDCETTRVNEAKIVQTGYTDDATLNVSCFSLDVSKTVVTEYTRTHQWSLDKSVDPASWALFDGESATSDYEVNVTHTGYTDNDWRVHGVITVANTSASVDVTVSSVEDVIADYGGAVTVDNCSMSLPGVLAHGSSFTCEYDTGEIDSEDSNPFGATNTATANVSAPSATSFSSDAEDVVFDSENPTAQIDETATAYDDFEGGGDVELGQVSGDHKFEYDRTFSCGEDHTYNNTASLYGDDSGELLDSDDASVEVTCYDLAITKDVLAQFDRNWTWMVEKDFTDAFLTGTTDLNCTEPDADGDRVCTATVQNGANVTVQYEVTVTATGTNGNYVVKSGDNGIVITNHHPTRDADLTQVLDNVSTMGAATVTCPSLTVPMNGGTLACTYTTDGAETNPGDGNNVATATQQLYDFASDGTATADGTKDYSTGDVPYAFALNTETNECATTDDVLAGYPDVDFGEVCATTFPTQSWTFDAYDRTFGPDQCDQTFINTATVTPNDGGPIDQDSETFALVCENGCTLTQGFYKTHSEFGPAPYSDLWETPFTPQMGDTPFFGTGYSWYEMFQLSPTGGNPYIKLAHQWMAAKLNEYWNGGAPSDVESALTQGEALLIAYQGAVDIDKQSADGQLANSLASTLASYNEGGIGPGHCTENTLPFLYSIFGAPTS